MRDVLHYKEDLLKAITQNILRKNPKQTTYVFNKESAKFTGGIPVESL